MSSRQIEDRLGCFGYFGFGGGWARARQARRMRNHPHPAVSYCNVCPRRRDCWARHRERVGKLFPAAWGLMLEIVERHPDDQGNAIIEEWAELTDGAVPPDFTVNAGNIEDGIEVGSGRTPKDRGERLSLTWPLKPLEIAGRA